MDDRVIIVSSDSHAGMPNELWTQYLEKRFHHLLPGLKVDNEIYPTATALLAEKGRGGQTLAEIDEAHTVDYHGLHDPVLRLADMDREGVTAELIYHGDARLGDLFHNSTNREYELRRVGCRIPGMESLGVRQFWLRHGSLPCNRSHRSLHGHGCCSQRGLLDC